MRATDVQTSSLYRSIVDLLRQSRQTTMQQVNRAIVHTYYEIGRKIVEEEQRGNVRAQYGKRLIKELSAHLTREFGKGFSERNLEQMRNFYLIYSKPQTLSAESEQPATRNGKCPKLDLSWSHYVFLVRLDDERERRFYEIESAQNTWSLKELKRQFNSGLYQRLALSRDNDAVKALSAHGQRIEQPTDAIKDPYVLEFLGLPEQNSYSESDLEQRLIDKLEHFLLELGKGFTFVARQKRISIDEKHFYIDLVFYNRLLKAFVLIDLKIGELKHQDIGQMMMYVHHYDRHEKLDEENKTVGIILCRDKSEALVELTLPEDNAQIFASRYMTVLPSKDELKKLLEE